MLRWLMLALSVLPACSGAELLAYPEFERPDPIGAIVAADRGSGSVEPGKSLALESARAAHVSFHLAAKVPEGGDYRLRIAPFAPASRLSVDLFREWFHLLANSGAYVPDALIPVAGDYRSRMPEPDNRVPKQTVQSFWVDLWIPADAPPGTYSSEAILEVGAQKQTLPIRITVLAAKVPADDVVAIDHNTYGTSWFAGDYPTLAKRLGSRFYDSDEFYGLIQAHHRIIYEHRGVFHQLGYGHAGKVGPEFAPVLKGLGKTLHVADWTNFDRHYGPLLDGAAFANTARGPKPIPFVYLPVNPEWPASFINWGEPGYEREFVTVLSEMEAHFRQKGWTSTRFELFFNHKKRYKGFPWDGDETRFVRDYAYFHEYARLLKLAVPAGSPVKFVFRTDASWTLERSMKELAGVINFWVCGGGMMGWYPESAKQAKQRGDIVWIYGGTPTATSAASTITGDVLRPWMQSLDGYVHWLTTAPGPDPWFKFGGGGETLIYPGDRFGIAAPIPSIRLKVQRNALEDLALLESFAGAETPVRLRQEAAKRFNSTTPAQWWTPQQALADTNPEDWSNADIDEAGKNPNFPSTIDPQAWQRVRDYVHELARRSK